MFFDVASWPVWGVWLLFAGAAAAIGVAGTRLTAVADKLADRTGLGEAVFGAVFIGGSTSLPGITVSFVAGLNGNAELAASNALGGIVAQTGFLAIADMTYRRANLEHAAASSQNLIQAVMLVVLLAIVLAATTTPDYVLWRIHPATIVLIAAYFGGLWLLKGERERPMWHPRLTEFTRHEEEDSEEDGSTTRLWIWFALLVPVLLIGGVAIERSASAIADVWGIESGPTGALLTAVPTSLPELVIAVTAVRRGALTLAVGDVLGGNAFDTLFLAAADFGFGTGSVYHQAGTSVLLLGAMAILVNAVLVLGFVRREPKGLGNIGFEGILVLLGTAVTYVLIFLQ